MDCSRRKDAVPVRPDDDGSAHFGRTAPIRVQAAEEVAGKSAPLCARGAAPSRPELTQASGVEAPEQQ